MKTIVHTCIKQPTSYLSHISKSSARNSGFTLVELMIALVLGLLISAAALQIFYTSSVNSRRQEASSQIQDNATFGLAQMQKHIRRANYGAKPTATFDEYFMNHRTPQGGVVLTAPTGTPLVSGGAKNWLTDNLSGLVLDGAAISSEWLTQNQSAKSKSNLDGIDNSDQLTIQYQAGSASMFDCEGAAIPEGFYVIERYFVRDAGLACASAIYNYEEDAAGKPAGIDIKNYTVPAVPAIPAVTTPPTAAAVPAVAAKVKSNNLTEDGTVIIPNVDYFRVMLGISSSTDFATDPASARISYMPIPATVNTLNNQRIFGIQFGILARSDNPTATAQDNNALRFTILDKSNQSLNAATVSGPKNLRNVYESTVLIRNARGGL
ncbi:PilW family protein [Psychrobacter sp. Pi2-1]|uniref:PilW family protein n=1 Tax=Psychrobacter sp. Pi2-1 TaxID=2774131 RepID=UPI001917D286|nr:PilW family protein [Psychrobacter sp. Pi2-1]